MDTQTEAVIQAARAVLLHRQSAIVSDKPVVIVPTEDIAALVKAIEERDAALDSERTKDIRALANDQVWVEGQVDLDDDAAVSEGSENGAYIQAWVWVSFEETPLDKNPVT